MTPTRALCIALPLIPILVAGAPLAGSDDSPGLFLPFGLEQATTVEQQLIRSLLRVQSGRLEDALEQAAELVREQPDFRLGQLVYGDVLSAMTGRLPEFAHQVPPEVAAGLQEEARARLERYLEAPPPGTVPSSLLEVPKGSASAILVDVNRYRLYVFERRDGRLVRTRDYYTSLGKGGTHKEREGDERTPIGVYTVTEYLPGNTLPDLYGVGAFPISYPNGWDRLRDRTGSGIWIHGTEWDTYSRPPLSSRGCVTVSNDDFAALESVLDVGETPVVVSDRVRWVFSKDLEEDRRAVRQALESWRTDWESRDTDNYLSHYAPEFRTQDMSYDEFADHKKRVNAEKTFIRVGLDDLGIYRYPGEEDLVLVEFQQRYESNNFNSTIRKQQYWQRQGENYLIVHEAAVE